MGLISFIGRLIVSVIALFLEKSSLLEDRKTKTRNLVESAHTLIVHDQALEKSDQMNQAEAQQSAIQAIKALRYDTKEYFWIHDLTAPSPRW